MGNRLPGNPRTRGDASEKVPSLISEKLALKDFDRSSSGVQSSQKLLWKVPTNSSVLFMNGKPILSAIHLESYGGYLTYGDFLSTFIQRVVEKKL
ncbi:hypothetical protein CEXT_476321 [Caerostris extrusa]|uniref:Uncharacterized protein n=1 Tax=Caerostris extrusa TaxID=172846 RepID=A0AAV4QPV1_CAEEX|nr:hypothetical protein CEXT_476321 [Caerostris extrusa]